MTEMDLEEIVQLIVNRAAEKALVKKQLHAAILPHIRRKVGQSAVSAWVRQDKPAMPAGDALLAMVRLSGLSLDELLSGQPQGAVMERILGRLDEIESTLGDVESRLGAVEQSPR
jgi:hypothetical protein